MLKGYRLFVTLVAVASSVFAAHAQSSLSSSSQKMMPSVVPLFLEGSGFSSVLNIVNEAKVPITTQVDVYSLDGTKLISRPVQVSPFGLERVSLSSLLAKSGVNADVGSIRLISDHDSAMLAVLAVTHHGLTDTYFDEEVAMPSMDGSNLLRGVADDVAFGSPLVSISSLSSTPQRVSITCLWEHGARQENVFELAPNQTLLSAACGGSSMANPIVSVADIIMSSSYANADDVRYRRGAAVGVAIATDGKAGELAAYGITPHVSRREIFYSSLNFTDPKMRMSSGLAYTGIPVGSSPLLPEGEYAPEVALANFGTKARSITITSATTIDGSPRKQVLAALSLAAHAAKTVRLDHVLPSSELLNSVVIRFDGAPGDVAAKLTSRSRSSPLHIVEMLERDESGGENGGGHPWTTEDGITSVLLLFNHSAKDNNFNVRFGTAGGPWMKIYKLAPMETRAIGINELIANQEKDDSGHTLPPDARSGEVGWQSDSTEVGGRLLQANPTLAMARNFSCGNYVAQCAVSLSPYASLDFNFGGSGDLGTINPAWYVFGLHPPTSCSCSGGSPTSSSLSLSYSWASGNSSIASVTSGASSNLAAWQGTGGGTTTGNYSTYQSTYNIMCAAQAPIKTHIPYRVDAVATISQSQAACLPPYPPNGYLRVVKAQVLDQFGLPYRVGGAEVHDQVVVGTPNALGIGNSFTTAPNTLKTDVNGQWNDNYSVCSTACYGSTGVSAATQFWFFNGIQLPGPTTVQYSCSGININGH
jgi:hypothetical protein